jgi:hypothetical protein
MVISTAMDSSRITSPFSMCFDTLSTQRLARLAEAGVSIAELTLFELCYSQCVRLALIPNINADVSGCAWTLQSRMSLISACMRSWWRPPATLFVKVFTGVWKSWLVFEASAVVIELGTG